MCGVSSNCICMPPTRMLQWVRRGHIMQIAPTEYSTKLLYLHVSGTLRPQVWTLYRYNKHILYKHYHIKQVKKNNADNGLSKFFSWKFRKQLHFNGGTPLTFYITLNFVQKGEIEQTNFLHKRLVPNNKINEKDISAPSF